MLNDQIASTSAHQRAHASHSSDHRGGDDQAEQFRDIHALAPPPPPPSRVRRREAWEEAGSQRSSSLSSDAAPSENFSTMSREFSALVLAGSTIAPTATSADSIGGGGGETDNNISANNLNSLLARIGEDDHDHGDAPEEETNPLAIVPDNSGRALGPAADQFSPRRRAAAGSGGDQAVTVQRVKKEEVEAKISAWQNAKVAKVNNRFKREEAVISGLESEQVQKATSWMKKVERKLEEKRARALEKMQNDVAKARRKAEERRASAEAKRGTKVARVFEIANLMRAVGRAPAKRSFF